MRSFDAIGMGLILGLILALTPPLQAQEPVSVAQWGGFGTLGVAGTGSHQVAYPRDTSQLYGAVDQPSLKEDSRLGLQGHLTLGDAVSGTLQVLSAQRYDGTFKPTITKAQLDWNPVKGTQVHAGRMAYESQLDQNVGYDFLWVRPPVEVYSALNVACMDGLDVVQFLPLGPKSVFFIKAYGGYSAGQIAIWQVGPMSFNRGREYGVVTGVISEPWWIGFSAGKIQIPSEFPEPVANVPEDFDLYSILTKDPGLVRTGSLFSIKDATERGWGVTVTYKKGPLQAEGQFTRVVTDRWLVAPVDSGCAYVGYKLGKVEPYLMYARTLARPLAVPYMGMIPMLPDASSVQFDSSVDGLIRELNKNQYTWSGGGRWDFATHAAFKVQLDWVHSTEGSSPMYVLQPGFKGRMVVMTALVDFVFGKEALRGFSD